MTNRIFNLTHGLPLTRIKIFLAGVLYHCLKLFLRKNHYTVTRRGIRYHLDLSELIDLSIFILGGFQQHITASNLFKLPENATIIDVGANIGSMALKFAKAVPRGTIYALEPSDSAYERLLQNIALNPGLSRRIKPFRMFVSDSSREISPCRSVYASWRVNGYEKEKRHPLHGGLMEAITPVAQITIDDFCQKNNIEAVDLIKIDTDGGELAVLKGARGVLEDYRPVIIFETGGYLMEERNTTFDFYFRLLEPFGYSMFNSKSGAHITPGNYLQQIPSRATIDIVAVSPAAS